MRQRIVAGILGVALSVAAITTLGTSAAAAATGGGNNDAGCRPSAAHPNPVVFLHGLGATYYEDLNFLQSDVASKGYCTFSATYGAYPGFP
ncbi:MAG: lipase, partial [Sciscionella sp.]